MAKTATKKSAKKSTEASARSGVAAAKKTPKRKATAARKYSPESGEKVGAALDEMKHGELRSGRSGTKVTDRKQAIAIGLSEARRDGADVPPNLKR